MVVGAAAAVDALVEWPTKRGVRMMREAKTGAKAAPMSIRPRIESARVGSSQKSTRPTIKLEGHETPRSPSGRPRLMSEEREERQ
jgi:hypothetical protein